MSYQTGSILHKIHPSLWYYFSLLWIAATVTVYGLGCISTYDIWWHLKTGEQILATHSFLPLDPFSYTYGNEVWTYKDWAADVLFFLIHKSSGWPGLIIFKLIVGLITIALIFWILLIYRRTPWHISTFLIAILTPAIGFRILERPAILSFMFTALLLLVLEKNRYRELSLFWCPVIILLMANLHRGALVAPLLVMAYSIQSLMQRPIQSNRRSIGYHFILNMTCVGAALASPDGIYAFIQALSVKFDTVSQGIAEYAPLSFETIYSVTPATFVIVILFITSWILKRSTPLWDILLVCIGILVAFEGIRFLPYFCLYVIPSLATKLSCIWPVSKRTHVIVLACAMIAFLTAVMSDHPPIALTVQSRHFPEEALQFVQKAHRHGHIKGHVFNEYTWGGYLLYHLWPDFRVFIDGRSNQVYSPAFLRQYRHLLRSEKHFQKTMDQYNVQWLFLDNKPHTSERKHLDNNPHWNLVFISDRALVYVRRSCHDLAWINTYRYQHIKPYQLLPSLRQAWKINDSTLDQEILKEARRLIQDDRFSIRSHLVLLEVLNHLGADYFQERNLIIQKLWQLGWRPTVFET